MPTDKFHCPECQGPLTANPPAGLLCAQCGAAVAVEDGILDFVRGRAGASHDPADHDVSHGINEQRSTDCYQEIRHLAGERWPAGLGSVLEIGRGAGRLSRALIGGNETRDLVLTDASLSALRTIRNDLIEAGLLSAIPVTFAARGDTGPCFRDVAFDTCVGTSVLHRIADVRGFLADVFRWLRPGGRAFFVEPNLRYHRALGQTLADILALLHGDDPAYSQGRQSLLTAIGQWRRGIVHQGDLPFLATLDDKHMFAGDAFEQMGRELGFAATYAIPTASQPTGAGIVAGLCTQLGVNDAVRAAVLGLLPAYANRYMSLLGPRDQSGRFLFWLEKGIGPVMRHFRAPPPPEPEAMSGLPEVLLTGGLPPRWSLELTASRSADGIALWLRGWCLANTDVSWVRVTLGQAVRQAAVWLPRPDVQQVVNAAFLYASWNALCCGVNETLSFAGVPIEDDSVELTVDIVLASGAELRVPTAPRLRLDDRLEATR